jgi:hypothetical protein
MDKRTLPLERYLVTQFLRGAVQTTPHRASQKVEETWGKCGQVFTVVSTGSNGQGRVSRLKIHWFWRVGVGQIMYAYVSKYKNDKTKLKLKINKASPGGGAGEGGKKKDSLV